MRGYPVPQELKGEEKPLGNVLSFRQLGYLAAGVGVGALIGAAFFAIAGLFAAPKPIALAIASLPFPFTLGAACLFAFAPAGWAGILPGPEAPESPDPFDPPLRFDQWLLLHRKFRAKPPFMPLRGMDYRPRDPVLFRVPASRGRGGGS